MSIDTEDLYPVAAVARANPATKSVHPKTLTRWGTRGVRGVRLECRRIGSRLMTSHEALARFLAATGDQATSPSAPAPRSPNERRTASEAAARELEKVGA